MSADSADVPEVALPAWKYGPVDYRRFAVWLTLGIHAWLYGGMVVLQWFVNDQPWILGWKPAVVAIVSTILFGRLAYSWIMRLDARYGRGSGWQLTTTLVKLPELRQRDAARAPRPGDAA